MEKRKVGRPKTKPEVIKKKDREFPYLTDEEVENIKKTIDERLAYGMSEIVLQYSSVCKTFGITPKKGGAKINQFKDLRKLFNIERIGNSKEYKITLKEQKNGESL